MTLDLPFLNRRAEKDSRPLRFAATDTGQESDFPILRAMMRHRIIRVAKEQHVAISRARL
jgi:hypothetical protein